MPFIITICVDSIYVYNIIWIISSRLSLNIQDPPRVLKYLSTVNI